MEKDALERTSARGILEIRFEIGSMEKGFNGSMGKTDPGVRTVSRTKNVVTFSFLQRNNLNIPTFFQRISPNSITISTISEQTATRNRRTISVHLL